MISACPASEIWVRFAESARPEKSENLVFTIINQCFEVSYTDFGEGSKKSALKSGFSKLIQLVKADFRFQFMASLRGRVTYPLRVVGYSPPAGHMPGAVLSNNDSPTAQTALPSFPTQATKQTRRSNHG